MNKQNIGPIGEEENFRWNMEMIEQLVKFLQAYKSKMEYQNLDFDGDRPAQYKELRIQILYLVQR